LKENQLDKKQLVFGYMWTINQDYK